MKMDTLAPIAPVKIETPTPREVEFEDSFWEDEKTRKPKGKKIKKMRSFDDR